MFIKITWDEVGGRVGISRGRKTPYFPRHFDGFPALIPWFSTGSTDSKLYHLPLAYVHCTIKGQIVILNLKK
jgi:hypothetical protein